MTADPKAVYASLNKLRKDANDRGMNDLGWCYFHSQTRILCDEVSEAYKGNTQLDPDMEKRIRARWK